MRMRLMAAVALAPLCGLVLAAPAWAATNTISTSVTTNQQTATAVSNGPGDIDVATTGVVNPSSGAAILINSNNVVTVEGALTFKDISNAAGIQAAAGVTSNITTSGTITLSESFVAATDSNGVSKAPFAQGSGRYGIQTLGAFLGNITAGGTITVQGNSSYGIAIQGGLGSSSLVSNLTSAATIGVTGDQSIGISTAGEITGNVVLTGGVSSHGSGSVGLQTAGKIDGALSIYTSVVTSGYSATTRPTTAAVLNQTQATPSEVQQSGAAVSIQADVAHGVFLGAPPIGATSTSDLDLDGIIDTGEGAAALTNYGSAPALSIGGPSAINLGLFGTCNSGGAGNNCFGLIVEGSISSNGVYDGVNATAVDLGVGGAGLTVQGGVRVGSTATITANAYKANATAFQIESAATVPNFINEGTITGTVTTPTTGNAYGLVIQAGAQVPSLLNSGTIGAGETGDSGSAYAIVDASGSLKTVVNNGVITTGLTPTNAGEATTGQTIALDLSANTTGVSLTQSLTGITPAIVGDVLLSQTGPNTVQLQAGSITGRLSLGAASGSSLTIDNGAGYVGALTYSGTGLTINVVNGVLNNKSATTLKGPSLTVGASGTLLFALDPQKVTGNQSNTLYQVTNATIANGAVLGATFLSTPTGGQIFTVIQATNLSYNGPSGPISVTAPFLFTITGQANPSNGTVTLTVQPKTAAQLGLNRAEAAAYPAVYASLGQDTGIQNALINASSASNFRTAYQQMLPNSSEGVFQVVSAMSKAVARASVGAAGFVGTTPGGLTNADDDDDDSLESTGGLWASEFIIGLNQTRTGIDPYRASGLGLVAGLDIGGYGADVSFASANLVKPGDPGDSLVSINRLEAGLYGAPSFGILHTEMRVAGGYLHMSGRREFAATVTSGDLSTTSSVARTASGSWSGYDFSGRLGAGAQFDMGRFYVMPQAHLDFLTVGESAYAEKGGGVGFNLNVSKRTGTEGSITAGLVAGARFGSSFVFKPQVELGWNQLVTGGPGATTARFAYGGPSFTIPAGAMGGVAVARLALKGDGEFVHFSVEAGGQFNSNYQDADLRAVFRISY